jgi:acyl carrier protein
MDFLVTKREIMMNSETLRETILHTLSKIAPNANLETIDLDVSFRDQYEIDSIDFLRLMMELEKELKVRIFDFDYPKLSTLRGCEHYLTEKLLLQAQAPEAKAESIRVDLTSAARER